MNLVIFVCIFVFNNYFRLFLAVYDIHRPRQRTILWLWICRLHYSELLQWNFIVNYELSSHPSLRAIIEIICSCSFFVNCIVFLSIVQKILCTLYVNYFTFFNANIDNCSSLTFFPNFY